MTDRINALVVALEHDIRDDDVGSLIEAILHMRGVSSIAKNVAGIDSFVAEGRAHDQWRTRLFALIKEMPK